MDFKIRNICFLVMMIWMITIGQVFAQSIQILNLRYNEDNSYLYGDTTTSVYRRMKYVSLGKSKDQYLSMGGEVRYQSQFYKNEDWGENPEESYTAFYTRFLFHTDLHLSRHIRFFAQLNSSFANGRVTGNRPVDENRLGIHQVFADWNVIKRDNSQLTLRVGRQELLYGTQRLISVKEGPNIRLNFDAVKAFYSGSNFQADLIYAVPVRIGFGAFDDSFNRDKKLWGMYVVLNSMPIVKNIDVYYLGYENRKAVFNDGSGEETRHSFGTRIWGKIKNFTYDVENVVQFGSFGEKKIRAYTHSLHVSYTLPTKNESVIGLKTEIISGDKAEGDAELNTFNPLFPRGAYFGLAAMIGPANLLDIHPLFQINITDRLHFSADYDMFWRHSIHDGLYGSNAALVAPSVGKEKHIGNQLGLSVEYNLNQYLTLTPEFTWFKAGPYLKDATPGKDVLFAAVTIQLKY